MKREGVSVVRTWNLIAREGLFGRAPSAGKYVEIQTASESRPLFHQPAAFSPVGATRGGCASVCLHDYRYPTLAALAGIGTWRVPAMLHIVDSHLLTLPGRWSRGASANSLGAPQPSLRPPSPPLPPSPLAVLLVVRVVFPNVTVSVG